MKFHDALARALYDQGTDTLFGLLADPTMQFADSFVRECGGTYIAAVHEAGAVHMAYGYAMLTGRLGVSSVDHGPGLTNSLTAVVDAVKSRVPLLLMYPDTIVEDKHYRQSVPQRELIIPTGAGFEQVRTAQTMAYDMAVAIRRAHYERRPIALNIPREFLKIDVEYARVALKPTPTPAFVLDEESLDQAVGIIASARRPIVVAGRGAIGAKSELLRLAERIGAPLATSLGAKDLFRGEEFELGIMGTLSNEVGVDTIADADCLIVFGAGLNVDTSVKGSLLEGKRVVHCDTDPEQLTHFNEVDAMLPGDAAKVATTIIEWLDEAEIPPTSFRTPALANRIAKLRTVTLPDRPMREGTIGVHHALARIDEAVPQNRIYVNDPGRHASVSWPDVHVQSPRDFVLTARFGAIGTGMAVAIGAAIADRSRPVLLVGGDGAFMLGGINEFNTAVRYGLDFIVVLCNDGSYGPEHMMLVEWGFSPEIIEFDWPDFGPVATALGGEGLTVRTEADLDAACELIANRTKPVLIDLKLDPYAMPGIPH